MNGFLNAMLSRRELLKTTACGFGYLALADLCARAAAAEQTNPLAPKAPAFQAAGQAGDLHVHARAPFACRHVRLQAEVASRRRQNSRRQKRRPQAAEVALQVRQQRQERPVVPRDLSEPGQACRRPVPAQQHVHRRGRPSAGHHPAAHGQLSLPASVDGGLDRCTDWAPKTRSCPAF